MKKSIHRYPNEYLKNEYDIIYLSENTHTHREWTNADYWMSGKSARLFQCRTRRDAKKLLTKFLFCEKKEIIVSTMAHTDGMEQRIRTNPLNREPNGSRSNLFLIIESLDCRSASQFLPGRIVPMLSIYIYIFFVIHTKKGEKEAGKWLSNIIWLFFYAATFQPTPHSLRFVRHANTGQQKDLICGNFRWPERKVLQE